MLWAFWTCYMQKSFSRLNVYDNFENGKQVDSYDVCEILITDNKIKWTRPLAYFLTWLHVK